LFLFCVFFSSLGAQDTTALRYSKYISGTTIQKHLSVLASDSLEGRETAQPGMEKAARYVAEQFAAMGLPAVNNNSYYQKIPLVNYSKGTSVFKTNEQEFTRGKDYFVTDAQTVSDLKATEIIFAGYGVVDSATGWDDYKNVNVSQKVILILEGEPVDKKGISMITKSKTKSSWSRDRSRKLQFAKSRNPLAILFVDADHEAAHERYSKRIVKGMLGLDSGENTNKIPVIYLSRNTADALMSPTGKSISDFEKEISKKKIFSAESIPVQLELRVSSEKTSCTNVLGYVEGSDLKEEVIVVSAHLDHLGKRGEEIYYGADDDGSGSASIITLAEVFAKAKLDGNGPKRSLLFVAFTGEEKGLLGSEYYTSNPVFPLDKTIANLNIDMIGRVDTFSRATKNYTYLIGSDKLSTQLHVINETINGSCCQLELDYKYNDPSDKERLYYRSDHYNFAKRNIPVIFYFTGLHADYHKPTDTIDKIDFEKTAGIARLVFCTAWELANRKERITVDVVHDFK
jgi:Peptidase family M28